MSGITIDMEFSGEEARQGLQDLLARMDRRRPFFEAVGERIVSSAGKRFEREDAPDGSKWKALKAATIKARVRKGQTPITILRSNTPGASGSALAGSIHSDASENSVRVGATKFTAAIHQLGGTIRKPARAGKIYRMKDENGQVGRRFAAKAKANHVTDVTIPAHTVTIPARPYLGVSAEDELGIFEDAEDWLLGRF